MRTQTFGYNAVLSVSPSYLRHTVEGMFDDARIPDSFRINIDARTILDVLFGSATASLDLPGTGTDDAFVMRLQITIADLLINGAQIAAPRTLSLIPISINIRFITDDNTIVANLMGLVDDDLTLPDLTPFIIPPPANPGALNAQIRQEIVNFVRSLPANIFRIPLSITQPLLNSVDITAVRNSFDSNLITLVLGLYDSSAISFPDTGDGNNPTRGMTQSLAAINGSPDTFAFRLSAEAFDINIRQSLDRQWPSFGMIATTTFSTSSSPYINISTISASREVTISSTGSPYRNSVLRLELSEFTMRERSNTIVTDEEGKFNITIPAGTARIEALELRVVSIRQLQGDGNYMDIHRPRIRLADGFAEISGSVYFSNDLSFRASYSAELFIEADPNHPTRISTKVRNPDISVGWIFEVFNWLEFAFSAAEESRLDLGLKTLTNTVGSLLNGRLPDPTRSLQSGGIAIFLDQVDITPTHIDFKGAAHAGRIAKHGIESPASRFYTIDGTPTQVPTFILPWLTLTLDPDGSCTLRSRGEGIRASSSSFQLLGERNITQNTFTSTKTSPHLPASSSGGGSVAIIKGAGNYHVKTVLNRAPSIAFFGITIDRGFLLRYVAYDPPLLPSIRLIVEGTRQTRDGNPIANWENTIRVEIDTRRLHVDDIDITWVISTLGDRRIRRTIFANDTVVWTLHASDLGLEPLEPRIIGDFDLYDSDESTLVTPESGFFGRAARTFSVTFEVTVEDVFGRTTTAATSIIGIIGYPDELDLSDLREIIDLDPRSPSGGGIPRPGRTRF